MRRRRVRRAAGVAAAALLVVACGDQPAPPPAREKSAASAPASGAAVSVSKGSAEKGKQVWLGQCVACHNPDPAKDGTLGPAVKGASPALLEARVVRGEYPPGYKPKRPTRVMPPRPDLSPSVPDLAAYLQ